MADIEVKHEETEDEPKEVTIRFTFPDVWTLRHWQTYTGAQQEFIASARKANQLADAMSQKFHAARSLFTAGYVHVTCDESLELLRKFKEYLASDDPPLALVGLLAEKVCRVIEDAFELPLA